MCIGIWAEEPTGKFFQGVGKAAGCRRQKAGIDRLSEGIHASNIRWNAD